VPLAGGWIKRVHQKNIVKIAGKESLFAVVCLEHGE
jgi:hypothetical protein